MTEFFVNSDSFCPKHIFECGQIFRYKKVGENYIVFTTDKHAIISQCGNGYKISCDDEVYFRNFFDLFTDYNKIKQNILADYNSDTMYKAINFGSGIRILNQNPFEMIVSFIISANNNIKRIQKIIENICETKGNKTEFGYAFPTYESLYSCDEAFYFDAGCGYRAPYLSETVKLLDSSFFDEILKMDTISARKRLLSLKGVGPKVADCILLFGLGKKDVFPVDVWIKRVYLREYKRNNDKKDIPNILTEKFGNLSGYIQQYLFYYYRENSIKSIDKE